MTKLFESLSARSDSHLTFKENFKRVIMDRYEVENWVDFAESDMCCYIRFIAHSTIYLAEIRKYGKSINFYKIEGNETL